jgi:hypothetical protein
VLVDDPAVPGDEDSLDTRVLAAERRVEAVRELFVDALVCR